METAVTTRKVNPAHISACEKAIEAVFNGEALGKFLKDIGFAPQLFHETIAAVPELADRYMRAKQCKVEMQIDEIVEIADTDSDPQRARNRIQVRQWAASKLIPKVYGDRIDLNVTQTVDLGSALNEAKQRALRPMRDQQQSDDAQVVEFKDINPLPAGDTESAGGQKDSGEQNKTA